MTSLWQAKPITVLRDAARRGVKYSTIITWLLHSAFAGYTRKLMSATLLAGLHLGSQAAAIYAIYWYAHKMQAGIDISRLIPGVGFIKNEPTGFLWMVVVFAVSCFALSALFLFLFRRLILGIAEAHYAATLEILVLFSRRLPDPRARVASELLMQYGPRGLGVGCGRAVLTAVVFANAIPAVLGAATAAVFLFWINFPLTILIVALTILTAVPLLYPIALRAARLASYREKAQLAFGEEVRGRWAIRAASYREKAQLAFREEVRGMDRSASRDGAQPRLKTARDFSRAYFARRRVSAEFIFATEIAVAVMLGLVICYLASHSITTREDWAIFIAYIAGMRLVLVGCSQCIRVSANVSRYYPQILRYYLFVQDMQHLDSGSLKLLKHGDRVILGALKNGSNVEVDAGQRIALVTTATVPELQIALIDARSASSPGPLGSALIDGSSASGVKSAIALLESDDITTGDGSDLEGLDRRLFDTATLVLYRDPAKAGSYGENYLLTFDGRNFREFAPLGTRESDAALSKFSRCDRSRGRKKARLDDDEDDD